MLMLYMFIFESVGIKVDKIQIGLKVLSFNIENILETF